MINFWVEAPRFENNHLIFSGVIPGGYNGPTGKLFKFILQGDETKLTRLNVKNLNVLLNDGQGTKTTAKISWQADALATEAVDTIAPEPFTALLGRAPDIFNNQWFVAFATQDKQNGIDYYEVAESTRWWISRPSKLDWVKTNSPYKLIDTTGRSNIFVRAVDRAGNERLTKIIRFPWYQSAWLWIIIGLFLCGVFLGLKKLHLR